MDGEMITFIDTCTKLHLLQHDVMNSFFYEELDETIFMKNWGSMMKKTTAHVSSLIIS